LLLILWKSNDKEEKAVLLLAMRDYIHTLYNALGVDSGGIYKDIMKKGSVEETPPV